MLKFLESINDGEEFNSKTLIIYIVLVLAVASIPIIFLVHF